MLVAAGVDLVACVGVTAGVMECPVGFSVVAAGFLSVRSLSMDSRRGGS